MGPPLIKGIQPVKKKSIFLYRGGANPYKGAHCIRLWTNSIKLSTLCIREWTAFIWVDTVHEVVRASWEQNAITLITDGWSDTRSQSIHGITA